MWELPLDARMLRALGDDVEAYGSRSNALMYLILPPVGIAAMLTIFVASGEIPVEHAWIIALAFPFIVAASWIGWFAQFRSPYLATGTRGVAFPLACHRIIPWSHITGFVVRSETTRHGNTPELHVAINISLKEGSLSQYGPTWRMAVPVFGYRSYFTRNTVLLSSIYCDKSEDEIREFLERAMRRHSPQPWVHGAVPPERALAA